MRKLVSKALVSQRITPLYLSPRHEPYLLLVVLLSCGLVLELDFVHELRTCSDVAVEGSQPSQTSLKFERPCFCLCTCRSCLVVKNRCRQTLCSRYALPLPFGDILTFHCYTYCYRFCCTFCFLRNS